MAMSFFEVERGFATNGAAIIAGNGAPSGSGDSAIVAIGSQYLDTATGALYIKVVAGAGAGNWQRLARAAEIQTTSWREPAKVADHTSLTIPTGTAGQPITIDGVSISNGARVLFTATTNAAHRNVWIYTQSAGSFVEDDNGESAGDQIFVIDGTSAGITYGYNATSEQWVQANKSDMDEAGFMRQFMGKSAAGNVLPTYSSHDFLVDGDSLQTAAGKLDQAAGDNAAAISAEITARANADSAMQSEIDATQAGSGLSASGSYSANGSANYIAGATSLKNADNLLDAQLKLVSDDVEALQLSDAAQQAILSRARTEAQALAITTATAIDQVLVDGISLAKWIVHVAGSAAGDAHNKVAAEIMAIHNGSADGSIEATDSDYNVFAKLKLGNIPGLSFSVSLTGSGAAQALVLSVSSTMAVDVKTTREVLA